MRGYRSHHPALREHAFIGGYLKDGTWLWKGELADSPMLYFDWGVGEPSGNGPCLLLFGDGSKFNPVTQWFKFDDINCDYKAAFICEKQQHE